MSLKNCVILLNFFAHGVSAYASFIGKSPNTNSQSIGHANGKKYGRAYKSAGSWTQSLCNADADGDGFKNGEELGDPCCVWSVGQTPAYTSGLGHPGWSNQKPSYSCCTSMSCQACCTSTPAPTKTYSYYTGNYGACSASCGAGTQTRDVYCRETTAGSSRARADGMCTGTAPGTSKSCDAGTCYSYAYKTGAYSASCSPTCGGVKTREVRCERTPGNTIVTSGCTGTAPATTTTSGCATSAAEECYCPDILLDVRRLDEFASGHASCASHFQMDSTTTNANFNTTEFYKVVGNNVKRNAVCKNLKIGVYCRSGSRASNAKTVLEGQNFKNVKNLGGWLASKNESLENDAVAIQAVCTRCVNDKSRAKELDVCFLEGVEELLVAISEE